MSSINVDSILDVDKDTSLKDVSLPSPYVAADDPEGLLKSFKEVKKKQTGNKIPLPTLEALAAEKISQSAAKVNNNFISSDLKPTGVFDSISNIIDIKSFSKIGDPRLPLGEVLSIFLGKYSERINKYNELLKQDTSVQDDILDSLKITPQELQSFFIKFKEDRYKSWDTAFVSYIRRLGTMDGMYTTPSKEYFVKLKSGESFKFIKYFYDRRLEIAKQFRAPNQTGEYYPIYAINNLFFKEFPKEAEAFKNASEFHYESPYGYTEREDLKTKTSPQGLVF